MKNFTLYKRMGAAALALTMASGLSAQEFAKFTPTESLSLKENRMFAQTHRAMPTFADYNNDGKLDVIYGGRNPSTWETLSFISQNQGNGVFTPQPKDETGLPESSYSNMVFFDFNNDGYLDVIVQSAKDDAPAGYTQLYKNLGPAANYRYELVAEASFRGSNYANEEKLFRSIAVGDLDKDGFLDIAIIGKESKSRGDATSDRFVEIYRNNKGDGTFTKLEFDAQLKEPVYFGDDYIDDFKGLQPMSKGSIAFGDIDNDGWLDIVVNGYRDGSPEGAVPAVQGGPRTKIYKNMQDGTFKDVTPDNFEGHSYEGEIKLADFNNDGYLDIFSSGWGTSGRITSILFNNGDGTFDANDAETLGFILASDVSAQVGDLNNDGRLDIVAMSSSYENSDGKYTTVYYQRPNGQFRLDESFPIVNCNSGGLDLGDVNDDNTLDVFILGYQGNAMGQEIVPAPAVLYINDVAATPEIPANKAPSAPESLLANVADGKLTLTWKAASDDITPEEALIYNVFVKDTKENKIFSLIPADLETGKLRTLSYIQTATRNLNYSMSFAISDQDLASGRYTVGVQAIDQSFVGGQFAKATLGTVSIVSEAKDKVEVLVVNEGILVTADSDLAVTVSDLSGRAIASGKANSTIAVSTKGIYLVTVAGKTYKIIK